MTDRIFLSLWFRKGESGAISALDRILEVFPLSHLTAKGTLRIFAIELVEPALLDREFEDPQVEEIVEAAREFDNPDCAYEVTLQWDLWQRKEANGEWALQPTAVRVTSYGPEFESDAGEQLLLEFGQEYLFLPEDQGKNNFTALRSNVRSLLRLASDVEERLPVERRLLWSDADEDLAERLDQVLG
jgi:hypothetical protein